MPPYVTHVALGFVKPDLVYHGDLDLAGTGLLFPFSGQVLKEAIVRLRQRHPAVRVLVSVGSWNHFGWDGRNFAALARLVSDLGADGVDLDYEVENPDCARTGTGRVSCAEDARMVAVLADLRRAIPRPAVLSVAGWNVGAYGEGRFSTAEPRNGPFVGMMLAMLRAPEAAGIDLVSVVAYDGGPRYQPQEAFRAYRAVWKGPLALGIPVMASRHGDARFTVERTARVLSDIRRDPQAGAMLYAVGEVPPGPAGPDNPDYRTLLLTICMSLELGDCTAPVP